MEIFKDSRGVKYTIETKSDGVFEALIIDANDTQIVRIERNAMTGERFVYVWDGQDEDYSEKVQFFPFKNKGEKTDKEKLETVYFAVVDTYDELTGKPILKEEEVLLNKDFYERFKLFNDEDPVFIHWAEEYDVVRLGVHDYLIINIRDVSGEETKSVYNRLRTEPLGDIEKPVDWIESDCQNGILTEEEILINGEKLDFLEATVLHELVCGALEYGVQSESYLDDAARIPPHKQKTILKKLEELFRGEMIPNG